MSDEYHRDGTHVQDGEHRPVGGIAFALVLALALLAGIEFARFVN